MITGVFSLQLKRLFIVGPMGVGKTTVGKLLADELGLRFIDSDRGDRKTNWDEYILDIRCGGRKRLSRSEKSKF